MRPDSQEIVVLGGGPAGGTAALFAARIGRQVTVLAGPPGGSLITGAAEIDNFPGLPHLSGPDFTANLLRQGAEAGAQILPATARSVEVENRYKIVTDDAGRHWPARALIVAVGTSPLKPAIPGLDRFWGKGVSFCAWCDGGFFRGRRVAVYGGGNTAFTSATILSRLAAEVHLLLPKRFGTAFHTLQREVAAAGNVRVRPGVRVLGVDGDGALRSLSLLVDQEPATLEVDGLFITLGQKPNTGFLQGRLDLSAGGFIRADAAGRTDLPGLFAAGDVVDGAFRQLVVACGAGATAALSAEQYLLQQWEPVLPRR
ncbi:MAG: FAD-dependent oxidoreductase [Candidatus Riflebacteria bacterium]|nr:FAD-dependent oxidoreductase [Candidatus Riflebacteria bacterium]